MRRPLLIAATVTAALVSGPAFADRKPTAAELDAIERVLRAEGYTSWEEIEFDDGLWEVDDARRADGTEVELKLAPETYAIVEIDD